VQTLFAVLLAAIELFNQPINDDYRLRVVENSVDEVTSVRLLLVNRANANRFWELGTITGAQGAINFTVDRADGDSIVLSSRTEYGILETSIKLFFNVSSKQVVRRVDFKPQEAMSAVSEQEGARVAVPREVFEKIRQVQSYEPPDSPLISGQFLNQPLPQPTFAEFSHARPQRVLDGYDAATVFHEWIGPYQKVGEQIWFGDAFYDGEGYSGIGAIGHFDVATKKYTLLRIPEVVGCSVSALFVEGNILWAGLYFQTEGEVPSRGLLRYDIATNRAQVYHIEDFIHTIVRSGEKLFMGTTNGIYVLEKGTLKRHRAEPSRSGMFTLITENIN
jgi:hypothetical protein